MTSRHTVFGIRHHGPGSARSLRQALEELQPDAILVEGPPDAASVLPLLAHAEMRPPVALLVHARDEPHRAAFYPFAEFSPEWQALGFGLRRGLPVRFMDLPVTHQLALQPTASPSVPEGSELAPDGAEPPAEAASEEPEEPASSPEDEGPGSDRDIRRDPLRWLAEAAGYSDGERWWEQMVEHRRDPVGLFAGILEAMTALREHVPPPDEDGPDGRELLREAWMRQTIRAALREGFERVAVVCGAWHAPALAELLAAAPDERLLKGLPKLPVQATWVPWTHGRLSYETGYGAGIESPGWYHHLWTCADQPVARWMTRVARLLRSEDLDASSAHIIEAVRLAETLAALRDRPLPGLPELNEATQTVFCFGSSLPMQLIRDRLIVGEVLGEVPAETPMAPLQADLQKEQKRLRLPPEAGVRELDLDLRKPNDLERSYLLHRLSLLDVPWGETQRTWGKSGTFHEVWRLQWRPELAVSLIEAGIWGSTLRAAAAARARSLADSAPDLPALTTLLNRALLSDLPEAVEHLMALLQAQAALASDVGLLMDALPPLVQVARYGNVRRTDTEMVRGVVDGFVARICIGLPAACSSLNDEAAEKMLARILAVQGAVAVLAEEEHLTQWYATLHRLLDQHGMHGLVAGRAARVLLDADRLAPDEAARRLSLALSTANDPAIAAAWVEGLLRGSGLILLHDDTLWAVLDTWLTELPREAFVQVLPLLRRTFSTFAAGERRNMGQRVLRGPATASQVATNPDDIDPERGALVLPLLAKLLGLEPTNP